MTKQNKKKQKKTLFRYENIKRFVTGCCLALLKTEQKKCAYIEAEGSEVKYYRRLSGWNTC